MAAGRCGGFGGGRGGGGTVRLGAAGRCLHGGRAPHGGPERAAALADDQAR